MRDCGGEQSLQKTAGRRVGARGRRLPGPPRPGRPAPAPRPARAPPARPPPPHFLRPPALTSFLSPEPPPPPPAPPSRGGHQVRPGPGRWAGVLGKRSAAGWDWLGAREPGSLQEGGLGREVLVHSKLGGRGRPGGDSGHLESIADGWVEGGIPGTARDPESGEGPLRPEP